MFSDKRKHRANHLFHFVAGLAMLTCRVEAVNAQGLTAIPAKILVERTVDETLRFSSTQTVGGAVCSFTLPIRTFGAFASDFPLLGQAGTTQTNGSLLVDRSDLLDLLSAVDAHFVAFFTDCGTNPGEVSPQALKNRITPIGIGETLTFPALYCPLASTCAGGGGSVENTFLRGDSNSDGTVDISDSVFTLSYLFLGGRAPACQDAADSNDDGAVDISVPIGTLGVLFLGGGSVPLPGTMECGVDPTADELGCETFEQCS